ncbi:phage tail tape measure protein [Actinacidiphila epipremni]|uniref:Phage tail tape measure protein domain-containing protein n=1 Tax=Actinacidiphila epipremni TaxID=2053013 RepID=A0ABX0ZHJ8_9ACTN|nr:hypothetical protein [Actinacidiphila epipremni]NJP42266.1 hypothetical protein [Actinacidiphila epipremni]
MPNVGYATLQIIPSVRGIADELRQQLVGPAAQAGERAGEEGGGGFRDAFKGALAALGVEAIAEKAGEFFSEAFSKAVEQGQITGKLKAQLGASQADASRYGKVVGQLYSKGITESFEDGAETVRALVSTGLVDPTATNAQLTSIATHMQDVSTTFGSDMTLQTQAVSALLKNHLAPDVDSALDVITRGFQSLGPAGEDVLETFQEYPVQLRKLGLDAETSLGLFQQGMQGGARDTDIVADALKEFSIRSIDMSASSRTAYAQLGYNHKEILGLEQQIARGGDGASSALADVLDRLRAIHDPVQRESAAVGLFGTQAEDLGQALFALDPTTAVETIGKVDGAANQLGDDLRSGPSYEIQVFKRTVEQGLVQFIGGKVLPILGRWGKAFDEDVLPPVAAVGGVLDRDFLPAVQGTARVIGGTITWLRQWGVWLTPIAVLVGGVALALGAESIAASIAAGATAAWMTVTGIATTVTDGFAAAQALLNSVMALNPFVLVAIAVVALATALFIAYKRSDTFRRIVQAAWQGIQAAAETAWKTVLKPLIAALVTGWQVIADGAVWLWRSVLVPAFTYALPVLRILATIVGVTLVLAFKVWWFGTKLYIDAITLLIRGVAVVAQWLYTAVIAPIVALIVWNLKLWWTAATLYINANIALFRALATVALWLWTSAISPVVGWIVAGLQALYAGGKYALTLLIGVFKAVGTAASSLYTAYVSPALHAIATVAQWLYDKGVKPPLDKVKQLAGQVGGAFKSAKDAIATQWGQLSGIAKKPIAFIINTVYNKGLVGVWNKVAGAFGAPKLGLFKGFAAGGPVYGAGTETSDDVPAWLSRNEHVWTAAEVKGAGGHGAVAQLRAWAAAGGLRSGTPGFKGGGGIFDPLKSAAGAVIGAGSAAWNTVKKTASWLKETARASAEAGVRAVVNPLLARIPGLGTGWGQMVRHVPSRMIDALFGAADAIPASGYDSGGWLTPGATTAVNATGRPEAILTASQWQAMAASAAAAQAVAAGASRYQPAAQQQPVIYLNAAGLDRGLVQWLQRAIRNEAGGSVQVYLGTGKG